MPGGRPMKFPSVTALNKRIDDYFKRQDQKGKPYTVSGLALHLDTSRETLLNYSNRGEYFDAIERAKAKCHVYAEEKLFGIGQTSGATFYLKNNFGYRDKSEVDLTQKTDPDVDFSKMTDEEVRKYIAAAKQSRA